MEEAEGGDAGNGKDCELQQRLRWTPGAKRKVEKGRARLPVVRTLESGDEAKSEDLS